MHGVNVNRRCTGCVLTFVPVLEGGHHEEADSLVRPLFEDCGSETLVGASYTSQRERTDDVRMRRIGAALPSSTSRRQWCTDTGLYLVP